jgi:hypothetical protein
MPARRVGSRERPLQHRNGLRLRGATFALAVVAGAAAACNALLSLSDFEVIATVPDATTEVSLVDGSCAEGGEADVDLKASCYPCTPVRADELLNACTSARCVPFERSRLTKLLPDGALPPLPPSLDSGGGG